MTFYLGTHQPGWLAKTAVPLFVSRRRLSLCRRLPRALGAWCLDSGGFSELSLYGEWTLSPASYVAEVRRFAAEIGALQWAACQDWMCEPALRQRTGLTIAEHQRRTVDSYRELVQTAPDVPWLPVLQGWWPDDYRSHWEQYERAGVDLAALAAVGLGSVCRRQRTAIVPQIIAGLGGLKLHGFGIKTAGLAACGAQLASADSLAWSFGARKRPALPGCSHRCCSNCLVYALAWRERVLAGRPRPWQYFLPFAANEIRARPESQEASAYSGTQTEAD